MALIYFELLHLRAAPYSIALRSCVAAITLWDWPWGKHLSYCVAFLLIFYLMITYFLVTNSITLYISVEFSEKPARLSFLPMVMLLVRSILHRSLYLFEYFNSWFGFACILKTVVSNCLVHFSIFFPTILASDDIKYPNTIFRDWTAFEALLSFCNTEAYTST